MKKQFITLFLLLFAVSGHSQSVEDIFEPSDVKISWLGIDFSHVKLIGEFSDNSPVEVRDEYFPKWNHLILSEPDKYDIKRMLRKDEIYYDIDMMMKINSQSEIEDMDSYNNPKYTIDDIKDFIVLYDSEKKEGIGVFFIAECLNKNAEEAYFHFIAINMKTNELLIHERLSGEPGGFGLRNYWAGSLYEIMKDIRKVYYKKWRKNLK